MSYLRADKRGDKLYWWLVECHWENGKPVQKRLKYFGTQKPTLAAANWSYAFGSKSVVDTKKDKKIITEKKPAKPRVVHTTEQDDLSWLLG